ncbi:hypothetical protein A2cp1_2147 [Anaeromyxobacter dehalogenans 2CP-1]|uniref:Uncharacterized protein n=1 Tax=Anaeromyxobacter dehalogenans (strain ATCC BAA-258 / DSM 21875 / 2CP-1) TaxID=455488 RepID=B8J981_ANAD2|nr:hypothetical protein A2cp1_2147 [Anaeromyxobacter dehalogenans 2CP-1]
MCAQPHSPSAPCDPAPCVAADGGALPSGAPAFAAAAALEAARALLGDDQARARVLLADALRVLEATAPGGLRVVAGGRS